MNNRKQKRLKVSRICIRHAWEFTESDVYTCDFLQQRHSMYARTLVRAGTCKNIKQAKGLWRLCRAKGIILSGGKLYFPHARISTAAQRGETSLSVGEQIHMFYASLT